MNISYRGGMNRKLPASRHMAVAIRPLALPPAYAETMTGQHEDQERRVVGQRRRKHRSDRRGACGCDEEDDDKADCHSHILAVTRPGCINYRA